MATKTDKTKDPVQCSVFQLRGMVTRLQTQVRQDAKEMKELKTVTTKITAALAQFKDNRTLNIARKKLKPKTSAAATDPHTKMGRLTKISNLPSVMTADGSSRPRQ